MYKHLFQFNSCELAQMSLSEFLPFQSIWTSCSQPSGYNDHRNMVRKSTSWHSKNCPVIDLSVSVHFWESVLPGQNVPFSERFWLSSSPVQFLGEPVWLVHSELKDKTESPLTKIQVHTDPFYIRYGRVWGCLLLFPSWSCFFYDNGELCVYYCSFYPRGGLKEFLWVSFRLCIFSKFVPP